MRRISRAMSNAETSQKARCGQQGRQRGCAGAPVETSLSESLSLPARGLSIEPAPSVRRANDRATQHHAGLLARSPTSIPGPVHVEFQRRFREQKFRMSGAILVDRRAGVGAIIHLAFDRSSIFFQFDQRASARGRGKKGSALGGTTLLSRGSAERNGSGCENCRRSTHFNLPALLGLSACPL